MTGLTAFVQAHNVIAIGEFLKWLDENGYLHHGVLTEEDRKYCIEEYYKDKQNEN